MTGRPLGQGEEGTRLRSGEVGGWREHLHDEHRAAFKELAGESLIALGYEGSLDW